MTGFALLLVLSAAWMHATWNFLAKRVGSGGAAFVYLVAQWVTLIYLPLVVGLFVIQRPQLGWVEYLFIVGSATIHLGYFLMLQRGYASGDLSLIYPLARGTGPTLSTLAAILFLGERPTWLAMAGGLLVIVGVFLLSGGTRFFEQQHLQQSLIFGLLTGVCIAIYTLWDKYAVSALLIPPLVLDYGSSLGRAILLSPYALRHRQEVASLWQAHRWEIIGVACLSPLAYILVLTALSFTPVSYVAPTREISVLIGVLMGSRLLREGHTTRRLMAAGLIVMGVMTLAFN